LIIKLFQNPSHPTIYKKYYRAKWGSVRSFQGSKVLNPKFLEAISAILSPIEMEAVAAGLGAFNTCT
jgi:hypothetical protein